MMPEWFPKWPNETCVVVASGPSLIHTPIKQGKGKVRFIAVNRSVELCPWADIWYGCDYDYWKSVKGGPDFNGMKMTIDEHANQEWPDIHRIVCKKLTDVANFDQVNIIGWGGNSGFHALQIAVKAGCKKVILTGVDCTIKYGVHWHGPHTDGLANPREYSGLKWKNAIDGSYQQLLDLGVKVINCSQVSLLRMYPKMSFEEAMAA